MTTLWVNWYSEKTTATSYMTPLKIAVVNNNVKCYYKCRACLDWQFIYSMKNVFPPVFIHSQSIIKTHILNTLPSDCKRILVQNQPEYVTSIQSEWTAGCFESQCSTRSGEVKPLLCQTWISSDSEREVQISNKVSKQLLHISLSGCGPSINRHGEAFFMWIKIKTPPKQNTIVNIFF